MDILGSTGQNDLIPISMGKLDNCYIMGTRKSWNHVITPIAKITGLWENA